MTTDVTLSNSLTDLAFRIRAEHEATAIAMRRGVHHAMAAGDLLIEAKALLKHGQWMAWLKDHCAMSDRTARLYMRLAENRKTIEAKRQGVANLTVQDAITILREADRHEDHHEAFCIVRDKCWSIIRELEGYARPLSPNSAEKYTEGMRWLLFWIWRLGEICLKLGEHKRLGLTEDEFYEHFFARLPEGGTDDIGLIIRDVFQAYRNETVEYGAL